MITRLRFVVLLFLGLIFVHCGDKIVSDCLECSEQNAAGLTTFSTIQQTVFNANCIACHSGAFPEAGMDLSEGAAYASLVAVRSNKTDLNRIEPFNSSASYIVRVLEAANAPQMPPTGRLNQATIDSVKAWIDRGALDN